MIGLIPNSIGSETNIKLPLFFICYSLFAFVISQIILLLNGEQMISGSFRIPAVWSAAHLLVLGWALMIAMGSMYQLVPVVFLTPIWNERFGFFQFAVTAAGITWFAAALYFAPQTAMITGAITLTGIILFIIQIMMTLKKQAQASMITLFVGTALFCLFATIMLGITLILSIKTGFAAAMYPAIFKTHLLLGLAGWFTLLIFGFSYKMVPMFSLSHGYSMWQARLVYCFYVFGLVCTALSFFSNEQWLFMIGFLFLLIGFACFASHMALILKKRIKRKLDKPFSFSLFAICCGLAVHLAAFGSVITGTFSRLAGPFIAAYFLLWIAFSIIGYLFKIVPFLWWTHKYSSEIGKKDVPVLKDMINEKMALPLFFALSAGGIIVFVALLFGLKVLFYPGQFLFSLAAVVFSGTIASVLKK
ncbi:hypothetical protein [Bacillus canaveralius]|uniref:hypothetical protein n=1 Tax=Bacillus canaveralius TaxID=1403243 RepID=UPI0027E490DF|nr:hypothetical protein [Bacillus canaveralius]